MKKILAFLSVFLVVAQMNAFAYRKGSSPSSDSLTYGHDSHGRLTRNDNMWNDSDGDGSSNYYDSSDSNSSVW